MTLTSLSKIERRQYARDLAPSIVALAKNKSATPIGLCKEVHETLAQNGEEARQGELRIPLQLMLDTRALTTNVYSGGGAFVETMIGGYDPVPRAASVAMAAGATFISGLRGNLTLPRQTGAETMAFLHETDTITPSDSSTGGLNLTPHRIAGASYVSEQLVIQSPAASQMVLESLGIGYAKALDRGVLVGTGVAGDVLGLHSNSLVNTKTFSGAATWAAVTDVKSTVLGNNANREGMAFVLHSDVEERWSNIQRFTGASATLFDVDNESVAGVRAFVTTAAPATGMLCGDFSTVVIALFGDSISIKVNPFTQSLPGKIVFSINALADCGTLRPTLWVRNADSVVA